MGSGSDDQRGDDDSTLDFSFAFGEPAWNEVEHLPPGYHGCDLTDETSTARVLRLSGSLQLTSSAALEMLVGRQWATLRASSEL
jgi:hypothetical protein